MPYSSAAVKAGGLHLPIPWAHHPPMRILVSGASGFIGSALVPALAAAGHEVTRLVRPRTRDAAPAADTRPWDPASGRLDPAAVDGFDAVVHLAGENIASGWWTTARKRRIRESRVASTALLAETLARVPGPPRVLLSASAVGFYGSRGDERLTEASPPGAGFLAEVCRAWEAAAAPAARRGIRVVHPRFGIVLDPTGGPLARMLPPFRLGLGGRIGPGTQWMSWIVRDDAVAALLHLLARDDAAGPVNIVAPAPVTNREFTAALAGALHRPARIPVPAGPLRLVLGEMATELLLVSQRVTPDRLAAAGYAFRFDTVEPALRFLLARGG
jgi:uncharacterized protein